MLILKDEHAIDVLNSGNIGHLWHDFHAIDVHATDVGDPEPQDILPHFGGLWLGVCFWK